MERRIDAGIAKAQFSRIMDLAVETNDRFIVERAGEPAVVILSVVELLRIAAATPEWLKKAWDGARERGLEAITAEEIDAEIAEHRKQHAA